MNTTKLILDEHGNAIIPKSLIASITNNEVFSILVNKNGDILIGSNENSLKLYHAIGDVIENVENIIKKLRNIRYLFITTDVLDVNADKNM